MKVIINVCLVLLAFALFSCGAYRMNRAPEPRFSFTYKIKNIDEKSFEYQMEMALLINDKEERYKTVEMLLKNGANPNKKTGQFKWIDTNPLWNCCGNISLAKLFIDYGADVKNRPYISKCIRNKIALTEDEYYSWKKEGYAAVVREDDVYSVVKMFLENGSDPNFKGIGGEKILLLPYDWNYKRYFNKKGMFPINHAIKYNSLKIVNLLLEYGATLDEKSLEYAKQTTINTGSSEMENLVIQQWEIQNTRK